MFLLHAWLKLAQNSNKEEMGGQLLRNKNWNTKWLQGFQIYWLVMN